MFKDHIRLVDIKAIAIFSIAYPIAMVKRINHKNVWLVSERHNEARDNGYWFYKYCRENHSDKEVYYVIDRNSKDRGRLIKYGNLVDFGSFRHYVIYLLSRIHISSQVDSDSPNSRVSNFLEKHNLLNNKRVFLQHGITKNKVSFCYYNVSRADLFVCTAKLEYEFCKKEFGYPEGNVKLLGLPRYDGLDATKTKRNQILVMPTWRAWLANKSVEEFVESNYYKAYNSLLCNTELHKLLNNNNINLLFYVHSDMQSYSKMFTSKCARILIASDEHYDVQTLLNESNMLITDYSSVSFDFAYLKKPICYYQFDYDTYRKFQHKEGYYKYVDNGFGPIADNEQLLLKLIENMINDNFKMENIYIERINNYFSIHDKNNCYRVYEAVCKI